LTVGGRRFSFSERVAAEVDAVAAMEESVEDGVGDGWFIQILMEGGDRKLRGDDGRVNLVSVLQDFKQVESFLWLERIESEIVEDPAILGLSGFRGE
jgi:hypothetical protein